MAVCTNSSNMFSYKISLENWNKTDEGYYLGIPFATSALNQSLRSYDFEMILWRLDIYPKGMQERDGTKYVEVYLVLDELPPGFNIGQFQIEVAFRIKQEGCDWPASSRLFTSFHSSELENNFNGLSLRDMHEVGTVEDRAVDGFLTLEFEVRTDEASRMRFKSLRGNDVIVRNFLNIKPADGEVKLVSEGREIPCHKFLLMTQSPVFKAMFEMNSMEKETNTVKIADCAPDAVEEFVKYLYRGTLVSGAKPLELMFGLLNLAFKYQVNLLKGECVDVLMDIMDANNVLKIYAVVDKLDLGSDVTDLIIDFMKNNIDVIVDKEDWSSFLSDYPDLMKEFVLKMSQELKDARKS